MPVVNFWIDNASCFSLNSRGLLAANVTNLLSVSTAPHDSFQKLLAYLLFEHDSSSICRHCRTADYRPSLLSSDMVDNLLHAYWKRMLISESIPSLAYLDGKRYPSSNDAVRCAARDRETRQSEEEKGGTL